LTMQIYFDPDGTRIFTYVGRRVNSTEVFHLQRVKVSEVH